jgi:hypothetical protein
VQNERVAFWKRTYGDQCAALLRSTLASHAHGSPGAGAGVGGAGAGAGAAAAFDEGVIEDPDLYELQLKRQHQLEADAKAAAAAGSQLTTAHTTTAVQEQPLPIRKLWT